MKQSNEMQMAEVSQSKTKTYRSRREQQRVVTVSTAIAIPSSKPRQSASTMPPATHTHPYASVLTAFPRLSGFWVSRSVQSSIGKLPECWSGLFLQVECPSSRPINGINTLKPYTEILNLFLLII